MRQLLNQRKNFSAAISFSFGVIFGTAAGIGLFSWGFVGVVLLFFALISKRRAVICGALGVCCAFTSCLWHDWRAGSELPGKRVFGTYEIRVTDPRLSTVSGLNRVSPVQAELLTFSLQEDVSYFPNRRIYVYLPDHLRPQYGDVWRGQGMLLPPDSEAVWQEERYEKLLLERNRRSAARGEERLLIAREVEKTGSDPGWFAPFLRLRDNLLTRILAGTRSDAVRTSAAALFFNAGGGLDPVVKKEFVLSGTIHLFCVSGMHVGIVTGIFLLLFLPIPFRLRHWLLPLAAAGYVLCAGAGIPALRVLVMVTIWSICRAELRWLPGHWIIALTAAGFLLYRPALAGDLGTLYTFLITGILLISRKHWKEVTRVLDEKDALMPRGRRKKGFLRRKLLPALYGCVAAFFGGLGISVAAQGLLLPGSVFTNLILTALLPAVFALGLLPLAGITGICGVSFPEMAFGLLGPIARGAARVFEPLPVIRPEPWEVVVYYLLLTGVFASSSRKVRWGMLAGVLLLTGSWIIRAEALDASVLVLSSDSEGIPMAAVHDPAGKSCYIVNAPERNAVYAAAGFLADRGVKRADLLTFTRPRSKYASAAPQLLRRMEVVRIGLPPEEKRSDAFYQVLEVECRREAASHFRKGGEAVTSWEQGKSIFVRYANPASGKEFLLEMTPEDAGRRVVLTSGNKREQTLLPWSAAAAGWICRF